MRTALSALLILCLFSFLAGAPAFCQATDVYSNKGISFSYPSGSSIREDSREGEYNAVYCTSADKLFFSCSLFMEKSDPAYILNTMKTVMRQGYEKEGAVEIVVKDMEEKILSQKARGWIMTFTLYGIPFENRTCSFVLNGRQVCITRIFPANEKEAAKAYFDGILSTLRVK